MNYQTYRPMTKPTHKRKTFTGNNFAEHNCNYVNCPQITHPPRTNTHNQFFTEKSKFPQSSTNSINFHNYPHTSQDKSENYPFYQQIRNKQQTPYYKPNYLSSDDDDYYQPDFLHIIREKTVYKNLDKIMHLKK